MRGVGWVVAVVLVLGSWGCERQPEPLVVTYWYLDFCHSCRATREGLASLAAGRGDLELRLINHRAPGAPEAIRAQGFKRHGLLVTRGDSVLLKQADHRVRLADVEAVVVAELGSAPTLRDVSSRPQQREADVRLAPAAAPAE